MQAHRGYHSHIIHSLPFTACSLTEGIILMLPLPSCMEQLENDIGFILEGSAFVGNSIMLQKHFNKQSVRKMIQLTRLPPQVQPLRTIHADFSVTFICKEEWICRLSRRGNEVWKCMIICYIQVSLLLHLQLTLCFI